MTDDNCEEPDNETQPEDAVIGDNGRELASGGDSWEPANGDDTREPWSDGREQFSVVHDFDDERPLSNTVTTVLASVLGVEPTEIDPLHASLDAGALDSLFLDATGEPRYADATVSFVHEGYFVRVHGDGLVEIEPAGGTEKCD